MLSLQTCPLQNPPYILHCFKAPPPSLSVCVNGTPSWFLPWGNTVCMLLSVSSTSSLPGQCWCLIYNCSYTFPLCPPSKKKKKLVPVQKSWQQQRISGTKFWTLTLTRYCNFLLQGRSGFSLLAGQHWWMWCRADHAAPLLPAPVCFSLRWPVDQDWVIWLGWILAKPTLHYCFFCFLFLFLGQFIGLPTW